MLRNESVVIEAGARTVPMPSGELSIPRLASGFDQAQWRDELENVAEGDATFERVKFEAKTLAEIITLPYELVEDMTGEGAEIIERAIRVALALKLDKAALYADGTAKDPVGIKSQPGVTIESIATDGAAPTNYAPFTKAAFALRRKNVKPTGFVYSERTAETVAGFVATDNQPLNPPRAIADLPHLSTNQVPDDLDEGTSTGVASDLFTANWADLWIGVRPEIGIRVETQRVLDNMAVKVLAYLRADVQLAHAESFHVTTGLLEDAS
jgi:HK97 family phage major capsid protein